MPLKTSDKYCASLELDCLDRPFLRAGWMSLAPFSISSCAGKEEIEEGRSRDELRTEGGREGRTSCDLPRIALTITRPIRREIHVRHSHVNPAAPSLLNMYPTISCQECDSSSARYTGNLYKAVPRFGEFCSCCFLPLLPQLACGILATWNGLTNIPCK